MKFNTKYLLALIPLSITALLIYWFSNIVSYVIIAWVISMIGAPVVTWLRKYLNKDMAAGITLALFISVGALLLYLLIPPLVNQARYLSKLDYEKVISSIEEPLQDWENYLKERGLMPEKPSSNQNSLKEVPKNINTQPLNEIVLDTINNNNINLIIKLDIDKLEKTNVNIDNDEHEEVDFFQRLRTNISYFLNPKRIQTFFNATVEAFGNVAVGIFSVLFISFFFLREQGLFYKMIQTLVPTESEAKVAFVIDEMSNLLIRYFTGILIQVSCIFMLIAIPLGFMGYENVLLIAFFAAILNVIPYIGPIIGVLFGIVITVSSNPQVSFYNELFPDLVILFIVFIIAQIIDNLLLQPLIFSKSVKAHPLEIFLIVLIGAKIGGILGMILAIPLYTVFRVIGKIFLSEFKLIQSLTRNL